MYNNSGACLTTSTVNSSIISTSVLTPADWSLSIHSTGLSCEGSSGGYIAEVSGSVSPTSYEWYVDGVRKENGSHASAYVFAPVEPVPSGASIYCVAAASGCVSPAVATSNTITATNTPNVTPTISIWPVGNTFCVGDLVTVRALSSHATSSTLYQWAVNGNSKGPATTAGSLDMIASLDAGDETLFAPEPALP